MRMCFINLVFVNEDMILVVSYVIKNIVDIIIKITHKRYSDVDFRIKHMLRKRISNVLNGLSKSKKTMELLGCSIGELKVYLQATAISNGYLDFDIENYSGKEYHIDHIRPCSSYDLSKPEEQAKCFHYSNLQILTAFENMSKGDKLT